MSIHTIAHDNRLCGLSRTALVIKLAHALYLARAEFYQLEVPHFEGVSVAERHRWVEKAADVLQTLAPIPEPASLFDQVVAVTRVHAAKVLAFQEGKES